MTKSNQSTQQKLRPPKSRQHPVTIEEVEDNDARCMNAKPKLSNDSTYILEDDSDNKQILFDRIEVKTNRKHEKSKVIGIHLKKFQYQLECGTSAQGRPKLKSIVYQHYTPTCLNTEDPPRRKRSY